MPHDTAGAALPRTQTQSYMDSARPCTDDRISPQRGCRPMREHLRRASRLNPRVDLCLVPGIMVEFVPLPLRKKPSARNTNRVTLLCTSTDCAIGTALSRHISDPDEPTHRQDSGCHEVLPNDPATKLSKTTGDLRCAGVLHRMRRTLRAAPKSTATEYFDTDRTKIRRPLIVNRTSGIA